MLLCEPIIKLFYLLELIICVMNGEPQSATFNNINNYNKFGFLTDIICNDNSFYFLNKILTQ